MSARPSLCFYESAAAYTDGEISLEEDIRNAIAHIFLGTRHRPYDFEIDEERVAYWIGRDALSAAIHVLIIQRDFKPPSGEDFVDAEETLVKMLLSIKDVTLSGYQEMSNSAAVLGRPLLYQTLVCVALEQGNRNLMKEMVSNAAPGPGAHLLFSPAKEPSGLEFRKFHEPLTVDGQVDNGCEVYCALIKTGWAQARGYMQRWAASCSDAKAGIQLVEVLVEHGIKIDEVALYAAIGMGEIAMLEYLLARYTAEKPEIRHGLLKLAATRKPNGVEYLKVLFKYGITNINWMPPPLSTRPNPRDEQEMRDMLPTTPLHKAAEVGNSAVVDWLIRHGAERLKDYWGHDQVQTAKSWEKENCVLVFQNFSGWELEEKNSSCCNVV
jgi:hypothetical protein